MFSKGTRTSSKRMSMWPFGTSSSPSTVIGLRSVMPGVSMGMRIIDCCKCFLAPVSVLPIKIMI